MRAVINVRLFLFGIFSACVFGAWGWFHVFTTTTKSFRNLNFDEIELNSNFKSEQLSKYEEVKLSATSYINGSYSLGNSNGLKEVKLFLANWVLGSENLSVLMHPPDVCWASAGWKSLDLGQPRYVSFVLKSSELKTEDTLLKFECRVMESVQGHRELVVWCALVGGHVLIETRWINSEVGFDEFDSTFGNSSKAASLSASRRVRANYFLMQVMDRKSARGPKQFIRLSTPVVENWEDALTALEQFSFEFLSSSQVKL